MITKIVKADLALCGKKMKDLIPPLRERGYSVDAPRLSLIINGATAKTENNISIENAITEIISGWKEGV